MKSHPSQTANLLATVGDALKSTGLPRTPQKVIVAVSGGVDSMTLLHLLARISEPWGWTLAVAHLDHRLRGKSSREDAQMVRLTAQQKGFPLFAQTANVKAYSREHGVSLEMAGRTLRHELYAQAASEFGANLIALGHHADDQVELLFLRLLRGSGGEGIGGMKLLSPMPGHPKLKLLRPMLGARRTQILQYAQKERISFREDASNADLKFLRNRIRTELLPLLTSKYQPSLTSSILRVIDLVGAESDLAKSVAQEWLARQKRVPFDRLHVAIQRQVIQLQLVSNGVVPEYQLIERLRASTSTPINLPADFSSGKSRAFIARKADGRLYFPPIETLTSSFDEEFLDITVNGSSAACFSGVSVKSQLTQHRPVIARSPRQTEYFDAGKVGSRVRLRKWRPGDRFHPIGMPSPVKVQDLFTNLKIPRSQRHARVLAESEKGEIFWIEGLRISEPHKVTRQTRQFLKWHWQRSQILR